MNGSSAAPDNQPERFEEIADEKCTPYSLESRKNAHHNLRHAKLQSERLRKNRSCREHRAKAQLAAARYPVKILNNLKKIAATPEFLTAFDDYLTSMRQEGKKKQAQAFADLRPDSTEGATIPFP